jgi:hypothetical protein
MRNIAPSINIASVMVVAAIVVPPSVIISAHLPVTAVVVPVVVMVVWITPPHGKGIIIANAYPDGGHAGSVRDHFAGGQQEGQPHYGEKVRFHVFDLEGEALQESAVSLDEPESAS